MGIFTLFKQKAAPVPVVIAQKPVEYCPACHKVLVKSKQFDGVYCEECGELLSHYVALPRVEDRRYWEHSSMPIHYEFRCSRCFEHTVSAGYKKISGKNSKENLIECMCGASLHAPSGFCTLCWNKLANNGRCINNKCKNYQKPEAARFIPVYEIRVPSPHCSFCGAPFIVYNAEVGNKKIAQIALGLGGYEWVSEQKGCSSCGHPYTKE